MKLIALRDFRNVPALGLRDADGKSTIEKAIHNDQIHKGAVFEIGKGATLDALRENDKRSAQLVAQLFVALAVGDANNKEVVQAVKDEIAIDAKRDENSARLNKAASLQAAGQAVVDALGTKK